MKHLAETSHSLKTYGQAVLISLQNKRNAVTMHRGICPDVSVFYAGALAQLGERLICIQEVRSSILLGSTSTRPLHRGAGIVGR